MHRTLSAHGRLRVLVTGEPGSGKSSIVESILGFGIGDRTLFTETSQPTTPNKTSYRCCWIVVDSSSKLPVQKDTVFSQLDYAVLHSGVKSVCFIISKIDLDHNLQVDSLTKTLHALVNEWRCGKIVSLELASENYQRQSLAFTNDDLQHYGLKRKSALMSVLRHLKNFTFSFVNSSCVLQQGLEELLEMLKGVHRQFKSLQDESLIQLQDRLLEHFNSKDYVALGKNELDALLMIDQQRRSHSQQHLEDMLCHLVDALLVQRNTVTGESLFVLASPRWFEKKLEYLAVSIERNYSGRGLVDISYFKRFIENETDIQLLVELLVFLQLCCDIGMSDVDRINRHEDCLLLRRTALVQDFMQNRCCLLLPWLLPEKEQETEKAMLKAFDETKNLLLRMTYSVLGKVPFTLFQQLCIRILRFPQTNCSYHWKTGIMVSYEDVTVAIEDNAISSHLEREICVKLGFPKEGSPTFLSQFWSYVANIIDAVELQLKGWNYTVICRLCESNFSDKDPDRLGPFRILHDSCAVGGECYLVFGMNERETGGLPTKNKERDVEVFRYSHWSETQAVRHLHQFCVHDGISTPSAITSRNVTTDPPGRPLHPHMKDEQKRLDSFRRWPSYAALSPMSLVRCGFFYTNVRDQVMCYNCGIKLGLWKSSHDPMARHKNMSPDCDITSQTRFGSGDSSVSSLSTSLKPTLGSLEFPPRDLNATPSLSLSLEQISKPEPITKGIESLVDLSLKFATEESRLATFDHRWPIGCPVRPFDLARAGFFYDGHDDSVQCFSCRVALRGWEVGDTAMGEHRRHSPYCMFVNNFQERSRPSGEYRLPQDVESSFRRSQRKDTAEYNDQEMQTVHSRLASFSFADWLANVSIRAEDMASAGLYFVHGDTVRCFHCHVMISNWVPNDVPIEEHLRLSPHCSVAKRAARTMNVNQVNTNVSATAERMSDYLTRLSSFSNWPRTAPLSPHELATAGFYYAGDGDKVRCFSCGVVLKNWQHGDTAWGEHGRYYPHCQFFQKTAPSSELVTAAGYDDPRSLEGPAQTSSLNTRRRNLPSWSLPAEREPLRSFSAVRSEPLSKPGINQDILDKAVQMGFNRGAVERAIVLNMQLKGSPYRDVNELIDDLIKEDYEESELKLASFASEAKCASEKSQATKKLEYGRSPEYQKSPFSSMEAMVQGSMPAHGFSNKKKERFPDLPSPMETGSPVASLSGPSDASSFQPVSQTLSLEGSDEEQLRELERRRTCKICLDREVAIVFLKCGHVVCCDECSKMVFECPICRQPIKARVRAFFA